ncbi:hypothetical protein D3C83_308640 [compost metagenome]
MLGGNRPFLPGGLTQQALANTPASAELLQWLENVGRSFKGTKIRFVSASTIG